MLYKKLNLLFLATIFSLATTIIAREIQNIRETLNHITEPDCLVVFDLDNTLINPPTDLGSDQWFNHLIAEQLALGLDANAAVAEVLPLYFHIHHQIDIVPTEPDLVQTLQQICAKCNHVIGLTSRSLPIVERTLAQLARQQLNFPRQSPKQILPNGHQLPLPQPHIYREQILFCGQNDKGAALVAYLQAIDYRPAQIIFVDDRLKYVQAVEQALQNSGIKFTGLRYTGCDHKVRNFNPSATQTELAAFLAQWPYVNPTPTLA